MRKFLLAVAIAVLALVVLRQTGMTPSSYPWYGAPVAHELEPLILNAWKAAPTLPSRLSGDLLTKEKESITAATVANPKVGQERYGHFDDKGAPQPRIGYQPATVGAENHAGSYWPVAVLIRATYKVTDETLNGPIKSVTSIENRRETCYAYKDKAGHWQVTFETPEDATPFYKVW